MASTTDLRTFEMLLGATGNARERLFAQLVTGRGRLLRMLLANEQPRTQMPGPARAQPPRVRIEEPYSPTLYSIDPQRIAPQDV